MRVDSFTVVDSIPHFRCSFWAASLWLSVFLRPANNSSIAERNRRRLRLTDARKVFLQDSSNTLAGFDCAVSNTRRTSPANASTATAISAIAILLLSTPRVSGQSKTVMTRFTLTLRSPVVH
jgi:hypothetical protein